MRVYEPLSASERVHKPAFETEADLQCDLAAKLRGDGFNISVGLNYRALARDGRGLVFDIVVFRSKAAIAIIEIKRTSDGHRVALDQTIQGFKYRHFGVPVVLFWDLNEYDQLKNFLQGAEQNGSESGEGLRIENTSKKNRLIALWNLRRRLDTASMAAFDAKMPDMEKQLETWRDEVDAMHKNL